MTQPSKTPRTDHYRTEFKRRKETSDLIEWMLDEFAQEERRLSAAQSALAEAEKELKSLRDFKRGVDEAPASRARRRK